MLVKKTILGMGFIIAMVTSGAFAGTPQAFLTVVDTVLTPNAADPNGTGRLLTIRLNNPVVHVNGFGFSLNIANPDIINFAYTTIDTVLPHWRYFTNCIPTCHPDSIYDCPDSCFNYNAQAVTQGTPSAGFDVITSDRQSESALHVNGIFQTSGSGPVLQLGNGVLIRISLTIFPISDSVPFS